MRAKNTTEMLIRAAKSVQKNARATYSGFSVGAALETADGQVINGCNIESSSYSLTICAERVALGKALSDGKDKFTRIAIVGPHDDYCPPCGACRQLLYDYAPDLEVILSNGRETKIIPLSDLLPLAFEESKLKKK